MIRPITRRKDSDLQAQRTSRPRRRQIVVVLDEPNDQDDKMAVQLRMSASLQRPDANAESLRSTGQVPVLGLDDVLDDSIDDGRERLIEIEVGGCERYVIAARSHDPRR